MKVGEVWERADGLTGDVEIILIRWLIALQQQKTNGKTNFQKAGAFLKLFMQALFMIIKKRLVRKIIQL